MSQAPAVPRPLDHATPAQRRAIFAPRGPVLVIAGPGAGKTFCLIERIRFLIEEHGVAPERICAVTYTNRAAGEIAARLEHTLGPQAQGVRRGTLHALAVDLLREFTEPAGLRPGFGIADDALQRDLVKRVAYASGQGGMGQWGKDWAGVLLKRFSLHRLRADPLDPDDRSLLDAYSAQLARHNLVDFDEILLRADRLLAGHPAIARDVGARWEEVLVDEVQDVNPIQYAVLRHLAPPPHGHLFAVGDDEQSIFSWTGANPEILRRVAAEHAIAAPIVLDRNHRSAAPIFERARALLAGAPSLFDKAVEATRSTGGEIAAYHFPTEAEEARWILDDIVRDRARRDPPPRFGDYAILYRTHAMGAYLERHCLAAGLPCRLAPGHAIGDDPVIAVLLDSLRILRAPGDDGPVELLAERMLPRELGQRTRGPDACLTRFRRHAGRLATHDPDRKRLWRFIYYVANLEAIRRSAPTVRDLVVSLLDQRIGVKRSPLEEHAPDLTDPAAYPGAAAVADRIRATQRAGGTIWIERHRGLEAALRGMLQGAELGCRVRVLSPAAPPGPGDTVLRMAETDEGGWPVLLFKALQLLATEGLHPDQRAYVTFDLETTDKAIGTCEIVEIGAARVRDGVVVDRFRELVRPNGPVHPEAQRVHGYGDADLVGAPPLREVWPRFLAFVGSDLLVAHNGHGFDIPVLQRLAQPLGGADHLTFFDTLPLARSLFRERVTLGALARRYDIDPGTSHHALDDALALAGVMEGLARDRAARLRRTVLPQLLGFLGLGIALAKTGTMGEEKALLLRIATPATLGKYGQVLEAYASFLSTEATEDAPPLPVVIERLGGMALVKKLRAEKKPEDRYPQAMARLDGLFRLAEGLSLDEAMQLVLDRAALSRAEGTETDPDHIQLLTMHATKGLEFPSVYIVGVEDYTIPGYRTMRDRLVAEIPEARRLLYVGMTRAIDRLVLTRVERRDGKDAGGSLFLQEMGLAPVAGPMT